MDIHFPNEKGHPICWEGPMPRYAVMMHKDIGQVTCVLCLRQFSKENTK